MTNLREQRKAKTRLDIARAAMRLFEERGYEAATAAEIARAAKFSERSFFRYFATKEDVVFFGIGDALNEVHAAIVDVEPDRQWAAIRRAMLDSVARFQEADQEFSTSVLRIWMTDAGLAGPFQRFCRRWQTMLAQAWSDSRGDVDPDASLGAQMVAHCVVSTCLAAFHVHVRTGLELLPLLEEAFDQLETGGLTLSHRRGLQAVGGESEHPGKNSVE